ncbi:alpha/beta fold hydrolase [Streptomyces sp. NPDC003027]
MHQDVSSTPPTSEPATTVTVQTHQWEGFACESRWVRTADPAIAPVLLLGGAFQTKEGWGRFERGILAHGDVLTVDPPGWGAGGVLPERYGADFLADALAHMVRETGLGRVNVASGSYGTAIAYRMAQRHPQVLRKVVLVGTMDSIPAHARDWMRQVMDHLRARRMHKFAESSADLLMNTKEPARVMRSARVRENLIKRMSQLTELEAAQTYANTQRLLVQEMVDTSRPPAVPVLVATGELDTFTTPALCRNMAAACSDSWFVQMANADHLVHLERTDETADLACRFYADRPLDGLPYCRSVERVNHP